MPSSDFLLIFVQQFGSAIFFDPTWRTIQGEETKRRTATFARAIEILLQSIPTLEFQDDPPAELVLVDRPIEDLSLAKLLESREEATRGTLLNLLEVLGGVEVREFVEAFLDEYPCKNGHDSFSDLD